MARQSPIGVPNVDALLDPAFARDQVTRAFGRQVETARTMAAYGSQLFKRVFFTRASQGVDDLMVIGALLRHFLSCFDGCLVCLENGAVSSAQIIARSQFEAWLYMRWMLHSDRERWARQYYVYDLRQERDWNAKLISGDKASTKHAAAWRETFGADEAIPETVREYAQARNQEIDRFLAKPLYAGINASFAAARRKKDREVEWYRIGPNSPTSLADMAKRLNESATYQVLYRLLSYKVHNSRSRAAFKLSTDSVVVEPIRHLKDFGFAFTASTQLAVRVYFDVVKEFRAEELGDLKRTYLESWREGIAVPDITIKTEYVRVPGR
jgi:hypothetical protein